jgi:hypothetical protein
VKAASTLAGHSAAPVRTPLVDLNPLECEQLDDLIKSLSVALTGGEPLRRRARQILATRATTSA